MKSPILPHLYILLIPMTLATNLTRAQEAAIPDTEELGRLFALSPDDLLDIPTRLTTGSDQGWLNTPAAAFMLTKEDLRNSGHTHIAEQLRLVPGMQVARQASNSWAISTRSFQHVFADMQLVLQDGREIYSPSFGGVFWGVADLPVEILDSIEVIRGPGGTLWGSNAVNGVINIQTLSAIEAQENVASIGGGNKDYGHFSFRQGGEILGGHYYTWGKAASYHPLHDPNPHRTELYSNQGVGDAYPENELFKFGFRADLPGFGEEGWTLRAEYLDHRSHRRFGGPNLWFLPEIPPSPPLQYGTDFVGAEEAHGANVHGEWKGTVGDGFNWQLHSYYSHGSHDWEGAGLDFHINTFEVDFKVGKQIGPHNLLAGYRYRDNRFDIVQHDYPPINAGAVPSLLSLFTFTPTPYKISEDLNSVFIQDTFDIRDDLHILAGTKYEDNITGGNWIPSARAWWNRDENSTLWVSWSEAIRLPPMAYRHAAIANGYFEFPAGTYNPVAIGPAPQISHSELRQWDLGYRQLFNHNLSLDITGFFGKYEELTPFGAHLATLTQYNTDTMENEGVEVALNWHPTEQFHVRASASYTDWEIEGIGAATVEYSKANWQGNLGINYLPTPEWAFHLHTYATEAARAEVPGYIRTDLGTTWTPNADWEISAHIQNLGDPGHPENFSTFFGLDAHEVPRTAYLQIRRWF